MLVQPPWTHDRSQSLGAAATDPGYLTVPPPPSLIAAYSLHTKRVPPLALQRRPSPTFVFPPHSRIAAIPVSSSTFTPSPAYSQFPTTLPRASHHTIQSPTRLITATSGTLTVSTAPTSTSSEHGIGDTVRGRGKYMGRGWLEQVFWRRILGSNVSGVTVTKNNHCPEGILGIGIV